MEKKIFEVTLGKSQKVIHISADNLESVLILIASDLPEEYYGLFIQQVQPKAETFCIICERKFFPENHNPLNEVLDTIRLHCGSSVVYYDRDDEYDKPISLKQAIEQEVIK